MKINLHSHTTFCDGKNSAEEMIESAIEHGFDVFGFSGHSYTPFDESYCMSLEGTKEYKHTVKALAEKYKSKIKILCGVEQDFFSNQPMLFTTKIMTNTYMPITAPSFWQTHAKSITAEILFPWLRITLKRNLVLQKKQAAIS